MSVCQAVLIVSREENRTKYEAYRYRLAAGVKIAPITHTAFNKGFPDGEGFCVLGDSGVEVSDIIISLVVLCAFFMVSDVDVIFDELVDMIVLENFINGFDIIRLLFMLNFRVGRSWNIFNEIFDLWHFNLC